MTRRAKVYWGALAAAVLVLSAGWMQAPNSVIVPGTVASAEGNSDNLYPLNSNPMRYQQVVMAQEFPSQPRWITRIAFRPDAAAGAAFSETLTSVQINLSTTPKTPATLSKTFASNIGANETVVFQGELALSSACTGPDGGPKDFDIIVVLESAFYYDPSAGNLLLDVRNFSGGRTTQLDAHDAPDSTARVWSSDVNSPTANSNDPYPSAGLVIKFISD